MTLESIIQSINDEFSAKAAIRDSTLARSRELIKFCANAIRATHRREPEIADSLLRQADEIAAKMIADAKAYPDIYFAGYTQDALKELSEAHLTRALILASPLPSPQSLGVESAAYVNGLAETVGELRRYALDSLRRGDVAASESMLDLMDEIYTLLITIDFPSAITRDLRRKTDVARSILERTRGDVTTAIRQEEMKTAMTAFEERVRSLD